MATALQRYTVTTHLEKHTSTDVEENNESSSSL